MRSLTFSAPPDRAVGRLNQKRASLRLASEAMLQNMHMLMIGSQLGCNVKNAQTRKCREESLIQVSLRASGRDFQTEMTVPGGLQASQVDFVCTQSSMGRPKHTYPKNLLLQAMSIHDPSPLYPRAKEF